MSFEPGLSGKKDRAPTIKCPLHPKRTSISNALVFPAKPILVSAYCGASRKNTEPLAASMSTTTGLALPAG